MNIMKWENLVNSQRIGGRPSKDEKNRSPFNSDHDKIIFSGAFRRLARKTQVHPLATNDHIHNRLTHSLEVACVGRSLGIKVGQMLVEQKKIPENISASDIGDIVQSTCLAHDIGNPPFGHTGESAIRSWFSNEGSRFLEKLHEEESDDLKMFEGNAQGLRVLTSAEYHPYDGGMRLTYATLGSFIKYPWTASPSILGNRPKRDKFGVFQSELEIFHEIANATGLLRRSEDDWYCRHPLVYLMDKVFIKDNVHILSIDQERFMSKFFNEAGVVTDILNNSGSNPYGNMDEIMLQLDSFLGSYFGDNYDRPTRQR